MNVGVASKVVDEHAGALDDSVITDEIAQEQQDKEPQPQPSTGNQQPQQPQQPQKPQRPQLPQINKQKRKYPDTELEEDPEELVKPRESEAEVEQAGSCMGKYKGVILIIYCVFW